MIQSVTPHGATTPPRPPLALTVAAFAMAGPLLGDLLFLVWIASGPSLDEPVGLDSVVSTLAFFGMAFAIAIPFAYLIGTVLAGLACAPGMHWFPPIARTLPRRLLIGLCCGCLWGTGLLMALRIGDGLNGIPETGGLLDDSVPHMLPASAALAGAACQGLIFLVHRRKHGSAIRHADLDP